MKKIFLIGMLFLETVANAQMPTGYCFSGFNATQYITNVKFGSINNSSVYASMKNGYTDYTSLSTSLSPGSSNNQLTVSTANPYGMYENLYVWIDFNRDGYFDNDGERVVKLENLPTTPVSVTTAYFNVPAVVSYGKTRMRISMMSRLSYPGEAPLYDGTACGELHLTDGETEDYAVTFCPVISIAGPTSVCPFTNFTVSAVGAAASYSWGICSTPIAIGSGATYTTMIPRPGLTKCIPLTAKFTNGCPTQMRSIYVTSKQCKMGDADDPELISSKIIEDVLEISNPGKELISIQVHSPDGRLVDSGESGERYVTMQMKNLTSGIYLVRIAGAGGTHLSEKIYWNR